MKQRVRVWDLPTRVFHWSLVLGIAFMYYSANNGMMERHLQVGVFLLGLVLFRLFWGVLGSQTAQFRHFIKGPKQIKRYLTGQLTEAEQPGHNPVGALMVVALLSLVSLQIITGLFSPDNNTYIYSGYLNGLVSSKVGDAMLFVHQRLFWVLIGFACVHVFSILAYAALKRIDLIGPMFTGYKKIEGDTPNLRFASKGLSWVIAIIVVALIYLGHFLMQG
ncbi:cytochrome b/b6 domain-containing protein [Neisseria sp. Ec49-e6-T10]|uniref:cytochrome b/b6 domain-containing protein n=1 Tax=Neisseria sp. Ec49-e6-T10 TaxID=3140744 RepID=UPI003EBAA552